MIGEIQKARIVKNAIRTRMLEFMGKNNSTDPTCYYITNCDSKSYKNFGVYPPDRINNFIKHNMDVARSLWDKESLIVHLDMEYVNFDFPLEPYINPVRSFSLEEPSSEAAQKLLAGYGISPLHLISGRGHHFVWEINPDSQAFNRLKDLGKVPEWLEGDYRHPEIPVRETVDLKLGRAFHGLGLLMEYVSQQLKRRSGKCSEIPVEITAVKPGPIKHGREIISVDISEYADPLHTRIIRIPFSPYRKPYVKNAEDAERIKIPLIYMIPLYEMETREALRIRTMKEEVEELASRATTKIPEFSEESMSLIRDYEESSLKRFHDFFFERSHEKPEKWPETYDRTPLDIFPPCVKEILEHPNDRLLKPAGIEHAVRTFLALGWHPRHIAGFIRSRYERDYGWGDLWYQYNAGMRADFYTRIFSGLFATGSDMLVDYNCESQREKGLCPKKHEDCNLGDFRKSLMERRKHDRLGCRPFNRLFISL